MHSAAAAAKGEAAVANTKQAGLMVWLWDQILHLWHGFRLLAVNTRVAMRLKRQVFSGQKLTRRETQLLERTMEDLLRLVPFSIFVILPGGELLLPVALAMFPNLMPSTFVTKDQTRMRRLMRALDTGVSRRRLWEHMVMRILWVEDLKESQSMSIMRETMHGAPLNEAAIRVFVPYFSENGPLAVKNLPDYILKDLCKMNGSYSLIESWLLPKTWHSVRMRFVLSKSLEKRELDDACLAETGVDKLTLAELELECARRRMRWFGPEAALRQQLREWLSLSLDPDVPNHLLLFLVPIATPWDVLMTGLTQGERAHIMGLDGFKDTPLHLRLRRLTEKAAVDAAQSGSEDRVQKPVMEEDLEELKHRIQEASAEDRATKAQFEDVKQALRAATDEELLAIFDRLAASSGKKDTEGEAGVESAILGRAITEHLCASRPQGLLGCTPERLQQSFQDFDIDKSGVVSQEEFCSFLSRMRR